MKTILKGRLTELGAFRLGVPELEGEWVTFWTRYGPAPGTEHLQFAEDIYIGKQRRLGGILCIDNQKGDVTITDIQEQEQRNDSAAPPRRPTETKKRRQRNPYNDV